MNWKFWQKKPKIWDKTPSTSSHDGFTDWEQYQLARNRCPDCEHEGFYQGPEGGMSTNIMCANDQCGSRFNVCVLQGGVMGERISRPSPNKVVPSEPTTPVNP